MPRAAPGLVAVVGSANLDLVVRVREFPAPGETVLGEDLVEVAGGKGLNQAVAVARTGSAALVGCLGQDGAGRVLTDRLAGAGVGVGHVRRLATPTGRAFIQVAPDGENVIVVAAGANSQLSAVDVVSALDELRPTVVLAQLEVPLASVQAAADWTSHHDRRFVLNPSPVQDLPGSLMAVCDPLVVNAGEAAALLGQDSAPVPELAAALAGRARSVVVTDGAQGAWVATGTRAEHVPGIRVTPVDTTGAGDEFVGCLAARLARGESLPESARAANAAAARVVALPRDSR